MGAGGTCHTVRHGRVATGGARTGGLGFVTRPSGPSASRTGPDHRRHVFGRSGPGGPGAGYRRRRGGPGPGDRAGHLPGGQHDLHQPRLPTTCHTSQYGIDVRAAGMHGRSSPRCSTPACCGPGLARRASEKALLPGGSAGRPGLDGLADRQLAGGAPARGGLRAAARARRRASEPGSGSPCRRSTPWPRRSHPAAVDRSVLVLERAARPGHGRSRRCSSRSSTASGSGSGCRCSPRACWPALIGGQPAAASATPGRRTAGLRLRAAAAPDPGRILGLRRVRRALRVLRDDERQLVAARTSRRSGVGRRSRRSR